MVLPLALLGLAALGTVTTVAGQRKAGKAQKRTMAAALDAARARRAKASAAAGEVVNDAPAEDIAREDQRTQGVAGAEADRGDTIARAFAAQAPGDAAARGAITTAAGGAAAGARRTGSNLATRSGFAGAMAGRNQRLRGLAHDNSLLGEDQRRADEELEYAMERAGARGRGMRQAGSLMQAAGLAGTNYLVNQPKASGGAPATGTRRARSRGGYQPEGG